MLASMEQELTETVDRLRTSVVRIGRGGGVGPAGRPSTATGTGFLLDAVGLVATNDHVIREATEVSVTFSDGTEVEGEVLGQDTPTDLALVRVPRHAGAPVTFGDSSRLRVGQFALAIGNALGLPGEPTVSLGVVSALGRPLPGTDFVFEGLIQTDAAVNPGNSGGPLVDLRGSVIGVTSSMIPFAQGVGFAVPSNTVRHVLDQIRTRGRVVRPWLGISAIPLTAAVRRRFGVGASEGVLVGGVTPRSPAEQAGLRAGDVLRRLGPFELRGLRDLLEGLSNLPLGGAVDVSYQRGSSEVRGVVRIVEAPDAPGSDRPTQVAR
jgi:serine protease Do